MKRDPETYGRIRELYDAWVASEAERPAREHLRGANELPPTPRDLDMSRLVFAAIGIGTGILLLALAAVSFRTAGYWGDFARAGAQVGYTLVGIFLLIAGLGGIIATWNHGFRILVRAHRGY